MKPRNNIKLFKPVDDAPTTEMHVPTVVLRTNCPEHGVDHGDHCFSHQNPETEEWFYGICNKRALRAGYNGKIHPTSLDRTIAMRTRG